VTILTVNGNGVSASIPYGPTMVKPGTPDRPYGTVAMPGQRHIVVSFQPPLHTGGTPITKYEVKVSGPTPVFGGAVPTKCTRNIVTAVPATPHPSSNYTQVVSNLCDGVEYTVQVRAYNGYHWSEWAYPVPSSVMPQGPPGVPSNVSLSATPAAVQLGWQWHALEDNNGRLGFITFESLISCDTSTGQRTNHTDSSEVGLLQLKSTKHFLSHVLSVPSGETYVCKAKRGVNSKTDAWVRCAGASPKSVLLMFLEQGGGPSQQSACKSLGKGHRPFLFHCEPNCMR